ncbi:MAG: hypothetical protein DSY33_05125 [Archaeoglobus sp.]|nr:MAG: hypothetical protein DSY33_05125 [Archaeoglobus sp.]
MSRFIDRAKGSRYCFPCLSGTCPLGMDFMKDCYPRLTPEQKLLFDELFGLRAMILRRKFMRKKFKNLPYTMDTDTVSDEVWILLNKDAFQL